MAQVPSAEEVPVSRQWAGIGGGVLAAGAWLMLFPPLAAEGLGEFPGPMQYGVFVLGLYLPLLVIALIAGWCGAVPVLKMGRAVPSWLAAGLAVGAGGLSLTLALSWLNGGVVVGAAHGTVTLVLASMVLTLLQTAMEEVLCRGWLQPALTMRLGPVTGLFLASLLFTVFHVVGGAREPVSLMTIMLAGILFGLLAMRSGGLAAPIAAHFAWNVLEDGGLGLVPNPGGAILGSIADLDLAGAPIWGGGAEGLNASIGTAAVLVALILPLALGRFGGSVATGRPAPKAG